MKSTNNNMHILPTHLYAMPFTPLWRDTTFIENHNLLSGRNKENICYLCMGFPSQVDAAKRISAERAGMDRARESPSSMAPLL